MIFLWKNWLFYFAVVQKVIMEFQYAKNKEWFQINKRLFVVFLNTINIPCARLYIVATTTETAGNFAAVVVVQAFKKKTQTGNPRCSRRSPIDFFFRKCTRLWQVRTFHFLSQHVRFELLNLHMPAAPKPSDHEEVSIQEIKSVYWYMDTG